MTTINAEKVIKSGEKYGEGGLCGAGLAAMGRL